MPKKRITQSRKDPMDIVKYLLCKFSVDGDLITNLKMQKLLYYVYVWNLIINRNKCFVEKFQAWPNGPVMQSVYDELKLFGCDAIKISKFLKNQKDLEDIIKKFSKDLLNIIDQVYEKYGAVSAFGLVRLTHSDFPWKNARRNLEITEKTNNEISDDDILIYYGKKKKEK